MKQTLTPSARRDYKQLVIPVLFILFILTAITQSYGQQILQGTACAGQDIVLSVEGRCGTGVNGIWSWEITPQPSYGPVPFVYGDGSSNNATVVVRYNSATNFGAVVYTDCAQYQQTNITVGASFNPTLGVTSTTNVCKGSNVTFTASSNAVGYFLYYVDDVLVGSGYETRTVNYNTASLTPGSHRIHSVMTVYSQCANQTTLTTYNAGSPLTFNVLSSEQMTVNILGPTLICEGTSSITLKAEVAGAVPESLGFAWYNNDNQIVDGNNNPYTAQTITIPVNIPVGGNAIIVYVTSSNPCSAGTVVSQPYTIQFTQQPQPPVVYLTTVKTHYCVGDGITFTADAYSTPGATLVWYLDGVQIRSENGELITTNSLTLNTGLSGAGIFTPLSVVSVAASAPNLPNVCLPPYAGSASSSGLGISFYPVPSAPVVTGGMRCGPGVVVLHAIFSTTNSDGLKWYLPNGTTVITTGEYTTEFLNATTQYYVSGYNVANGGCEGPKLPIIAVINPIPDPSVPYGNNSHYGSGFVTLHATPGANGNQVWWTDLVPGQIKMGNTQQTPFISVTTSYTILTHNSGTNCNSAPVTITATILQGAYNTVSEYSVSVEGVVDSTVIKTLPIESVSRTSQYFDGIGRIFQTVTKKASPAGYDLVTLNAYDEMGRENIKFLPYASPENRGYLDEKAIEDENHNYINSSQYKFYNTNPTGDVANDTRPYAQTVFDGSPLNRPLKQSAPGVSWAPNPTEDSYSLNDNTVKQRHRPNTADASDKVHVFSYDPAAGQVTNTGIYPEGELLVAITFDEKNNDVLEYVDKEGRTICKKLKVDNGLYAITYYLYDDFGNLIVVLPPEAVKALTSN